MVCGMALLLAGAAVAAEPDRLPGVGEGNPRLRVEAGQPPWRAVARLQVPGIARCTAVVVAPLLAVTAAHCLWSARLRGWVPAGSVHLLPGYDRGAYTDHILAISYRVAPGYDPADTGGSRGADLAVVTLSRPAGSVLALADAPPAPGTPAVLGGFNQDRIEVIEADLRCAITGTALDGGGRTLLLHDCTATRGTSGGPLMVRGPAGELVLAGVQVAARLGQVGGAAVPVAALRRLLGQP
jgi:protease YdgD